MAALPSLPRWSINGFTAQGQETLTPGALPTALRAWLLGYWPIRMPTPNRGHGTRPNYMAIKGQLVLATAHDWDTVHRTQ